MTTPTPKPQGAQVAIDPGILLPAAAAGSGSLFGFDKAMAGASVQVGGLLPVTAASPTAEDVMKAFASASPQVKAQIQQMLYQGGFYGKTPPLINHGVVGAADIAAMKQAVTDAAQTGADLNEYLTRQAQFGVYQTIAGAIGASKPLTITKADPNQLGHDIDREFQALTGRKATEAEKAGFISAFNAAYTASQTQQYQDTAAAKASGSAALANSDYNTAPITAFDPNQIGPDRAEALNNSLDVSNLQAMPQMPAQPATVTQQSFDPTAFAEDYVRQHAGADTGAHDVASQFNNFLSLLGGIK